MKNSTCSSGEIWVLIGKSVIINGIFAISRPVSNRKEKNDDFSFGGSSTSRKLSTGTLMEDLYNAVLEKNEFHQSIKSVHFALFAIQVWENGMFQQNPSKKYFAIVDSWRTWTVKKTDYKQPKISIFIINNLFKWESESCKDFRLFWRKLWEIKFFKKFHSWRSHIWQLTGLKKSADWETNFHFTIHITTKSHKKRSSIGTFCDKICAKTFNCWKRKENT